ncbi:MAG: autotransporter domain-containing protein [Akkermansia sp.]|nr:autotransporter domain-containing protein [Akkermansia sp.]
MKLHLPNLLRAALLACMAAFPVASAATLIADGVDYNNLTSSTRFFDNGKGYYYVAGWQPWRGAGELFNQFHNFSFMGDWASYMGENAMTVTAFAPLRDDANTCWYNTSANMLAYWESYYGIFYEGDRTLPYGYTYDKQYLTQLGGTQSLKIDKLFYDTWTNEGGDFMMMSAWYLNGSHVWAEMGDEGFSELRDYTSKGGYFSKWFPTYQSTFTVYQNVDGDHQMQDMKALTTVLEEAFGTVKNSDGTLSHTATGQIVYFGINAPVGGHAVTCWGYETGADGNVNCVYLTNSDDGIYSLFKVYLKMNEGEIYLYKDAACTQYWDYAGANWYVDELEYIPTPDSLKNMYKAYSENELAWSGTAANWSNTPATPIDVALPDASSGWQVQVSGKNYAANFDAGRSISFTDAAAGSKYAGNVNIGSDVQAKSVAVNAGSVAYKFTGNGHTVTADSLVKSGTATATMSNVRLAAAELTVTGGKLSMESGSSVAGSTVQVQGGTLAMAGGSLQASSSVQVTGGQLYFSAPTQATTPTLTIGSAGSLGFLVDNGALSTPVLSLTGSLTLQGVVAVNFENVQSSQVSVGSPYRLVSSTQSISVTNLGNVVVSSTSVPNLDSFESYLERSEDGKSLYLVFSAGTKVYWAGGTSGTWNTASENKVWASAQGGTADRGYDGDYLSACFVGGNGTISISSGVKATEWLLSNANYSFTGAANLTVSKRITVENGSTLTMDAAPGAASATLKVDSSSNVTVNGAGDLVLWGLDNSGSVTVASAGMKVSSAISNGGTVSVGTGLTLGGGTANSFGKLTVGGAVSYDGGAGSLSVGDGSKMGSVNGGALTITGGSATITGDSTLQTLRGQGNLTVNDGLTLTDETSYGAALTVGKTLTLGANATMGSVTAGTVDVAAGMTLTVTGTLDAATLVVNSMDTADSPQYFAADMVNNATDFSLSDSVLATLRGFDLVSGETLCLLRNTGATPFTMDHLTVNKTTRVDLQDGANHVVKIGQDAAGNVILTVSVADIVQWNSSDMSWNNSKDWDKNGTSVEYPDTTTSVGFLGEGTPTVLLDGDKTVKSVLIESVSQSYQIVGPGTLSAETMTVGGGNHSLGDGKTETGVKLSGNLLVAARGGLAVEKAAKLEADTITIDGSGVGLKNSGRITATHLDASGAMIVNLGSLTVKDGIVGSLQSSQTLQSQGGDLTVLEDGKLTIVKDSRVGYLDNRGAISMTGSQLNLMQSTMKGGDVTASRVVLSAGSNGFDALVAYLVSGNSGTQSTLFLGDGTNIVNLVGDGSLVAKDGTVAIDNPGDELNDLTVDTETTLQFGATSNPLYSVGNFRGVADSTDALLQTTIRGTFDNSGELVSNRALVMANVVANGGDVAAPALTLAGAGNSFGNVETSSITFSAAPVQGTPLMQVESLAPQEDAVSITFAAAPAMADGAYEIISGAGETAESCTLSNAGLTVLRRSHMDGTLYAEDDSLWLGLTVLPDNLYPHISDTNGSAGAAMVSNAFFELSPQLNRNEYGDLSNALDALDEYTGKGDTGKASRLAAAVAGASIPTLAEAQKGDLERQLRAIRNRTTTMGLNTCSSPKGLPYVNAWVNAESDYRKVRSDKNLPGYTYSSWGGTAGVDLDVAGSTTVGMAVTAMFGKVKSDDVDNMSGNLDNIYLSAFARYSRRAWVHTLVATVGFADVDYKRSVEGLYGVKGDTTGTSFGLMYEAGYTIAMNEDATACIQPIVNLSYMHTELDGFSESGSDAALKSGSMDSNNFTLAAGARVQSTFGANVYNRTSLFEGRALVKGYFGDRDTTAGVSLTSLDSARGSVKSSETGSIGLEVGAGLYIPVGLEGGTLFVDGSGELRQNNINLNATFGYRLNF